MPGLADGRAQPDVVLLYAPPWDSPTRFSKHHLASYFARQGRRVLFVEAPLTPLGLRRGRSFLRELERTRLAPQLAADRLWVRRHFLPVPYHSATWLSSRRVMNRIGQRLLAPAIRRDFRRFGFDHPLVIAGLPHAADVLAWLPRHKLMYHCADDYTHAGGFPSTLAEVEGDLCRRADLVITTSETLCKDLHRFNPKTYWVPNGADIEHFSVPAEPAAELHALPRPIVGFVGGLSEWVDLDLISLIARQRPSWSIVLIGPVAIDTSVVRSSGNVKLLGPRPYATLPSYLAAMDVALIPFTRSPLTYHADPIKAYEYLAAGVPVVASAHIPSLQRLSHVVRLADSPDAFVTEIQSAIDKGREAQAAERVAEAARHSWTARFQTIEQLICAS